MFVSRPSIICLQPAKEARNRESDGVWRLAFGVWRPEGSRELSPGLYEAELVKTSLRKSVLKSFWFIWAAI
jgi:hypothetical protein